jgi:hypothetical protein
VPPLVIDKDQIDTVITALDDVINKFSWSSTIYLVKSDILLPTIIPLRKDY